MQPLLMLVSVASCPPTMHVQDTEQLLDELIEQTDALEGFTATYGITIGGESAGQLVMAYEAPGHARIEWDTSEFGGHMTLVTDGEEMCATSTGDEIGSYHARFEVPEFDPDLLDVLDARFPPRSKRTEGTIEPGPQFVCHVRFDEAADEHSFDLSLTTTRGDRRAVLRWLFDLRSQAEHAERTDDELVFTEEHFGWRLDLESGFLHEMWFEKDGRRHSFVRDSLELTAPDGEATFRFPEREPGVEDRSAEMEAVSAAVIARTQRWACLRRIDVRLEESGWDAELEADARDVLTALHGPQLDELARAQLDGLSVWLDKYVEWLDEHLARGRGADELREHAAEQWASLEARHAEMASEYVAKFPGAEPDAETSDAFEDVLGFEAEVFTALHAERVIESMRSAFDRRVADVLDAEGAQGEAAPDRRPGRALPWIR